MLKLQSLNNQLTSLKLAFDQAIMQGSSFSEVKSIYIQMKELEAMIIKRELMLLKDGQGVKEANG